MGISRLESIIRNAKNSTQQSTPTGNGIIKMSLNDLPTIPNTREYPHVRTVVIDTSEFIYKSIIGGDHTSGILNFLEKMFRCQLMPIFVFDGKPPKEKTRILEERKRIKERARERVVSLKDQIVQVDEFINMVEAFQDGTDTSLQNRFSKITNTEESDSDMMVFDPNNEPGKPILAGSDDKKLNYQTLLGLLGNNGTDDSLSYNGVVSMQADDLIDKLRSKISDLHCETERVGKKMVGIHDGQYSDIKQLFSHFNIPYIHAGVEAEMICAALVKLGIADYCIGNDMDLFALGCPRIIRNINFRDDNVDVYYLDNILANLGLSYIEFVDLCILLGSDYTGRLGGVKNYHILEYIRKYRSIEAILDNVDEINTGLLCEYTEDGTQRVIRVPEPFNYNEARAIFKMEFTTQQIGKLFSVPVTDIYQSCANKCLDLRYNYHALDGVSEFCSNKCDRLNNMLIVKKINAIIWSNLFKDEKQDDFILVKSKKTSPINIHGRRTDIINDIRARSHKNINNFSRVAFGSSPNHAMVMMG